ncbi:unnamed protein product [Diamesa serratosioi]
MTMSKIHCFILLIFCASNVIPESTSITDNKNRCSSLSCVHASASLLDLINLNIDPCVDFYEYACGNFVEEVYTPDEKSTVDTLTLMNDKLTEYLLTVYTKPFSDSEPKLHRLSKKLYQSCVNIELVKERKTKPLLDILTIMNGFPMLEGTNWDDAKWNWPTSLLNLRKHISKKDDDIFGRKIKNEIEKQNEFYRKKLTYVPPRNEINRELKNLHKRVLWMELYSRSYLFNDQKFNGTLDGSFIQSYYEFIKETPNRTLANYVGWRVVQSSLSFMHKEIRDAELRFYKNALGKEDFEQRWKLCAIITQIEAPVSTGSLFVKEYFPKEDKILAVNMVESLIKEYNTTIDNSIWMDEQTKEAAKLTTTLMKKYIGYHDKLESKEADDYYNDLYEHPEENFLEMGLAFKIFETDRQYKRLYDKHLKDTEDWTKYSKPATINAFYNSKDNSIQFPAGILQSPNFDKNRPDVMNFGAIGSIIGHEITHAFDNLAEKIQNSLETDTKEYLNITQCFVDQYNKYRINRVDNYVRINFTTNGKATLKENIADCGGVKLSYNTYKNWSLNTQQKKAIGLDGFSNEQIFWISFAQTFCSVERTTVLNNKDLKSIYALNRFRVIGPTSNMKEFANDFNCPDGSPMNPAKRCAVF